MLHIIPASHNIAKSQDRPVLCITWNIYRGDRADSKEQSVIEAEKNEYVQPHKIYTHRDS